MDKQKVYLDILINSCNKVDTGWSTGMGKVRLDFYRDKNDSVLILLDNRNKEAEYKYLNDLDVISKEELFLRLFTGCVGPSTIGDMLRSFDEYYDESISSDISAFLKSLEASKIIICYTESMGGSTAALVILYKICQQINIDCIPIIIKPVLFKGSLQYKLYFEQLLVYIDTNTYLIYDENVGWYKLGNEATMEDITNICEAEILKIANSRMKFI